MTIFPHELIAMDAHDRPVKVYNYMEYITGRDAPIKWGSAISLMILQENWLILASFLLIFLPWGHTALFPSVILNTCHILNDLHPYTMPSRKHHPILCQENFVCIGKEKMAIFHNIWQFCHMLLLIYTLFKLLSVCW